VISSGLSRVDDPSSGDAQLQTRTEERKPEMTQLSQTQRRTPTVGLAGLALAAAMLGGIVGGVVGIRAQSITQDAGAAQAVNVSHPASVGQPVNKAQDDLYISPRDQGVLKAAQDWEARERQMYPTVNLSPRDQGVLKAAQDWEARERQMYPTR
jgi:hypothetical protein